MVKKIIKNIISPSKGRKITIVWNKTTGFGISRVIILFLINAAICAPDVPSAQSSYQIPRTVYVGDRAMLVLPLPDFDIAHNIEIDTRLLSSDDIELYRIVLESRGTGSRLVMEFSGFSPGCFDIPPFEAGGMRFSGLQIEISSILARGEPVVLSELAAPLSIPGTGFFLYGVMFALVLLLLGVLWTLVWGRRYFARWLSAGKKRRLISLMARMEKRLRKDFLAGKDYRRILDAISHEFRIFLTMFTGINCRAMTPGELEHISNQEVFTGIPDEWGSGFLLHFFTRCDFMRFGGRETSGSDIQALLADLRGFLISLYKLVWENNKQEKQAA